MFSKAQTKGRNDELKLRFQLREDDSSLQGYLKYPEILMMKRNGENDYSKEKEF